MKEKTKIIMIIIFILILVIIISIFNTKSINKKVAKGKNQVEEVEKKEETQKGKYKFEGTYTEYETHSKVDNEEEKINHSNIVSFVVIRSENNSINLYRCTYENGCKKETENIISCNDEYTICTNNVNNEYEKTTYTYTFSDNELIEKQNSVYCDNSTLEFTRYLKYDNNSIKLREYKESKSSKETTEQINPTIGMTADEVRASTWGNPKKINKSTYSLGTTEQWVYYNNKYVYFKNGKVTSISE